jgi:hypothetical protein
MMSRLLWWGLRHRRWRAALNAIIMAVTVAVVMLFVTVTRDLSSYVNKSADRELTRGLIIRRLSGEEIPMSLGAVLERIEGIAVVQRYRLVRGRHPSGATYVVVGEQDSGVGPLTSDFFPVESAVAAAWRAERPMGAIVTEATARDLRLDVGAIAEIPTGKGPIRIKVVGISRNAKVGQRIAVHFDYLQEATGHPDHCEYRIYTKAADYDRVARAISEQTRSTADPVRVVRASDFAASWARRASTVPAILGFLGAFLILTTALTIANNTALSIRERRVELATMRVLGYRRRTLAWLLLGESAIVGLLGGLVAIAAMSWLFRSGVQLTPGQLQLLEPVTIGAFGIACGIGVAIVVPLLGAVPMTMANLHVPVVDALRDS